MWPPEKKTPTPIIPWMVSNSVRLSIVPSPYLSEYPLPNHDVLYTRPPAPNHPGPNSKSSECDPSMPWRTWCKDLNQSISFWIRRAHYGLEEPKIQTEVLGHSLVRSLLCSHRSLVRLLRTARFARALRSLTSLVGQWMIRWLFYLCFFLFSTIARWFNGTFMQNFFCMGLIKLRERLRWGGRRS